METALRAAKVDANHSEIVKALRSYGCSVQSMAQIGKGCPDLLVGYRNQNFILELKDGSKPPSARRLTPDEEVWHREWRGAAHVVLDVPGAIAVVVGR